MLHLLVQGKSLNADGRDDAADLTEIRTAMKVLMFSDQEIWCLFRILAGLLHIGNIKYNGMTMMMLMMRLILVLLVQRQWSTTWKRRRFAMQSASVELQRICR
jgi:hypothetical protein